MHYPIELIRKKRDGEEFSPEEIEFMVDEYTNDRIPDYQFAAFLMAVYLKGLNTEETNALTGAMLHSGKIIDLSKIPGKKIGKHSTGGVGDKVTILLAPVVAACGVVTVHTSGRGLGHTGGTLDKLAAIPGFISSLPTSEAMDIVRTAGAVLLSQTDDIAPADRAIYALRDVTGTIESLPLITASIMSKKLAEGLDGLVLDVKTGNGAFMKTPAQAKALAAMLLATAKNAGKDAIAYITDMNQPLGHAIGNWNEIVEVIEILNGKECPDLVDLTCELAGAMIFMAGIASNREQGKELALQAITSGAALKKFTEIVRLQHGDTSFISEYHKAPKPGYYTEVLSPHYGYVKSIDTYRLGMLAIELGAGRLRKEDEIDPYAGIHFFPKIGDYLDAEEVIAAVSSNKPIQDDIISRLRDCITLSKSKTAKPKLIKHILI